MQVVGGRGTGRDEISAGWREQLRCSRVRQDADARQRRQLREHRDA